MKYVINIAGYGLILAACSFAAGSILLILSNSFVTVAADAQSGFAPKPRIIITSPSTSIVSQPMIQIIGYFPSEAEAITFDIKNLEGVNASLAPWQRLGYVTRQYIDQARFDRITQQNLPDRHQPWNPHSAIKPLAPMEDVFTTNFFQCYDVPLAKGTNVITIHVKDKSGNQYTTKRRYILDYTKDKTPPVLTLIWPTNNVEIGGDHFELSAKVDKNCVTVRTSITDAKGKRSERSAIVERSGLVWVKHLPVSPGYNKVSIVTTDAAGNSSTNNFRVRRSSIIVEMQPLDPGQLNRPLVNVHGTINDPSCSVKVNGILASVCANGTWDAQNVPVSPTGMASFSITAYHIQ
jgi:hypothetical protein